MPAAVGLRIAGKCVCPTGAVADPIHIQREARKARRS